MILWIGFIWFYGFYMILWENLITWNPGCFGCFDMFRPFCGVSTGHVSIKTILGMLFFSKAQANQAERRIQQKCENCALQIIFIGFRSGDIIGVWMKKTEARKNNEQNPNSTMEHFGMAGRKPYAFWWRFSVLFFRLWSGKRLSLDSQVVDKLCAGSFMPNRHMVDWQCQISG